MKLLTLLFVLGSASAYCADLGLKVGTFSGKSNNGPCSLTISEDTTDPLDPLRGKISFSSTGFDLIPHNENGTSVFIGVTIKESGGSEQLTVRTDAQGNPVSAEYSSSNSDQICTLQ